MFYKFKVWLYDHGWIKNHPDYKRWSVIESDELINFLADYIEMIKLENKAFKREVVFKKEVWDGKHIKDFEHMIKRRFSQKVLSYDFIASKAASKINTCLEKNGSNIRIAVEYSNAVKPAFEIGFFYNENFNKEGV